MDYTANKFANWDYNDNVYLITNIKPASTSTSSSALSSTTSATLFSTTLVASVGGVLDDAADPLAV
jgi:hypothetical protein